jgi:predicted MFS family arabinose efflux permease
MPIHVWPELFTHRDDRDASHAERGNGSLPRRGLQTEFLERTSGKVIGTTFSGYLVDRIDPRKVLAVVYGLRGSALLLLFFVSEPVGLFIFAVIYGLDWYASGPATTTIIARAFGSERVGRIFGTVFVFHQFGGAAAAISGGWARVHFGDYQYAFLVGGCMGLIAACLALSIDRSNVEKPEMPVAAELADV